MEIPTRATASRAGHLLLPLLPLHNPERRHRALQQQKGTNRAFFFFFFKQLTSSYSSQAAPGATSASESQLILFYLRKEPGAWLSPELRLCQHLAAGAQPQWMSAALPGASPSRGTRGLPGPLCQPQVASFSPPDIPAGPWEQGGDGRVQHEEAPGSL